MFRNNLVSNLNKNEVYFLKHVWTKLIPGLVRVPFYSPLQKNYFYNVYYSEVSQKYYLSKINLLTSETLWKAETANGGYGTPLVLDNIVLVHSAFDGIACYDTNTGALNWELHTKTRTRCSLNTKDGLIYFTAGDSLYQISNTGSILKKIKIDNHFLYGNISFFNGKILILSTFFSIKYNTSRLEALIINETSFTIKKKINLIDSPVISSDTSGCFIDGDIAYITANSFIFSLNLKDNSIIWSSNVEGFCGRHLPIVDDKNVFYTTTNGYYGALSKHTGQCLWVNHTKEGMIMNPPSAYGKSLFIMANASILILDKENGTIIQSVPCGHAPYSACIINGNHLLVGGGEPPLNGAVHCFRLVKDILNDKDIIHYETNASDSSLRMSIFIKEIRNCRYITLITQDISVDKYTESKIKDMGYLFTIKLKNTNLSGYYYIPLIMRTSSGRISYNGIIIHLNKEQRIPTKKIIDDYIKPIIEENTLYSGAAISQAIYLKYGKIISQKDFREIISYVKYKSNWPDADFQTWRLILNRVLCSPANNLGEFIRNENQFERITK